MSEGQLFDYICHKQQFVESEAACFIYQLLDAVQYLHNCYIAHLDIKVKTTSVCFTFYLRVILISLNKTVLPVVELDDKLLYLSIGLIDLCEIGQVDTLKFPVVELPRWHTAAILPVHKQIKSPVIRPAKVAIRSYFFDCYYGFLFLMILLFLHCSCNSSTNSR